MIRVCVRVRVHVCVCVCARRPGHINMGDPLNQLWLADNWPNGGSSHKERSTNCCNNADGSGDAGMITYSRPGQCADATLMLSVVTHRVHSAELGSYLI